MDKVVITGQDTTIEEVIAVGCNYAKVEISPQALQKINQSRNTVETLLKSDKSYYGINTGFGSLAEKKIPPDQVTQLQKNLVLSHATGVGPILPEKVSRLMMFLRAVVMAKGYSGVRVEVVQRLMDMLNNNVHPVIPAFGSVGASGDLAPLAHLSLTLIGEGEVMWEGNRIPTNQYFRKQNLKPLELQAKEGLALLNGTQYMTALAVLAIINTERLIQAADLAGALTLEALDGIPDAFDHRIHQLRQHPGQIETAQHIRKLIDGSKLIYSPSPPKRVQDPYSLRCLPQVHGTVRDTLNYLKSVVSREINAVTDNPLIFSQQQEILSGGNFHGQPIAIIMDLLCLGLANLGGISERRIDLLLDWHRSGLPPFLTSNPGVESGYMIAHLTAVSLLNILKTNSCPSSSDSVPTSTGREDHISFGSNAAWKAYQSTDHLSKVLGVELLAALRAIDLRKVKDNLGILTGKAYQLIRKKIPFYPSDQILSGKINKISEIILKGELFQIYSS
ncbi:MAG: histidine ammonia-lyase [bacterium]